MTKILYDNGPICSSATKHDRLAVGEPKTPGGRELSIISQAAELKNDPILPAAVPYFLWLLFSEDCLNQASGFLVNLVAINCM